MKDRSVRGMFVATLGALIAAATTATFVWGPGRNVSDAIALILVIMTVVGVGLLVAGAFVALSANDTKQEDQDV